jgi:UDP-N-acetylglucosamine 2-epimerase (non-hydrolysing)
MKKVLFVYGTRPEAIKLAPLVLELKRRPDRFTVGLCVTGQHRELLDQVHSFFGIEPEHDLDVMRPGQTLVGIAARCLEGLERILVGSAPDLVCVQGDTTSALAGALAAFYAGSAVSHVEAGLRSGERRSPFPEELNRKLVGQIAEYHFAPTGLAADNLRREGITENVFVVGNTGIDALRLGLSLIERRDREDFARSFPYLENAGPVILVTGHRRENLGKGLEGVFEALRILVQEPATRILSGIPNIHLLPPLGYPRFILLMERCDLIITDSGGIQEEAPFLGKPVLVTRAVTERKEGIAAGAARLAGTDAEAVAADAIEMLSARPSPAAFGGLYGDGRSSARIADILES